MPQRTTEDLAALTGVLGVLSQSRETRAERQRERAFQFGMSQWLQESQAVNQANQTMLENSIAQLRTLQTQEAQVNSEIASYRSLAQEMPQGDAASPDAMRFINENVQGAFSQAQTIEDRKSAVQEMILNLNQQQDQIRGRISEALGVKSRYDAGYGDTAAASLVFQMSRDMPGEKGIEKLWTDKASIETTIDEAVKQGLIAQDTAQDPLWRRGVAAQILDMQTKRVDQELEFMRDRERAAISRAGMSAYGSQNISSMMNALRNIVEATKPQVRDVKSQIIDPETGSVREITEQRVMPGDPKTADKAMKQLNRVLDQLGGGSVDSRASISASGSVPFKPYEIASQLVWDSLSNVANAGIDAQEAIDALDPKAPGYKKQKAALQKQVKAGKKAAMKMRDLEEQGAQPLGTGQSQARTLSGEDVPLENVTIPDTPQPPPLNPFQNFRIWFQGLGDEGE